MKNIELNKLPKEVIQDIRAGYKVDDPTAGMLQEELNSALTALSLELYSDETHFVLELIQNADDNDYGKGVIPKLTFRFRPDRLIVTNNEMGFTSKNVWSLCRTGKSTKNGNKLRYTGEKGIGFKSVFVVSDAPEIHSNGYHFKFNRTDKSKMLGYVVPCWIEPSPDAIDGQTTIILPAPTGASLDDSKLNGLDSRTLLFLRQLKGIDIEDKDSKRICRREDNNEITVLKTIVRQEGQPQRSEQEICVRTEFLLDMGAVPDEKRLDIASTVIVLAFPVEVDRRAKPDVASQLYAFLPVRRAGFRFSIHADFILSSTRQDVMTNRPWNKRLLSGISAAFCDALEIFKKSEKLGYSYLEFIPKETEIPDEFFKPVRQEIIKRLSKSKCLLSSEGIWSFPAELRTADDTFRQLFHPSVARELFGFDYVDSRMGKDSKLLHQLGVNPVLLAEVIPLFTKHSEWLKAQPKSWTSSLYSFLANSQEDLIKQGLLTVPSLPLNDGRYVVPNAQEVYFPLAKGGKEYGFEDDLCIVDVDLFDHARENSERVDELLRAMKVLSDSPYSMIAGHILPKHNGEAWKSAGRMSLLGHLRYIKDKLEEYLKEAELRVQSKSSALDFLRANLWVGSKLTINGQWFFSKSENLYLSDAYGPTFSLEENLKGVISPDALVSDEYLTKESEKAEDDVLAWRKFLVRLGVHASPKVVAVGSDWVCSKELSHLLGTPDPAVRLSTLLCISAHWASYSDKTVHAVRALGAGLTRSDSSFVKTLRATWVLTAKGVQVPISLAYYPADEIRDVMGESVAYVDSKLSKPMLEACQVVSKVDAKALIQRLVQLRTEGDGGTSEYLQKLYRRIEDHFGADNVLISNAFSEHALIRVTGATKLWMKPEEVCWRSSGDFLDSICPPLAGQYKDFSKFFTTKLGVSNVIPNEKLVEALESLNSLESVEERKRVALSIYRVANRSLKSKSSEELVVPTWFEKFWSRPLFLNHRGEMVKQGRTLLVDDEPEFSKHFSDCQALSFLAVPYESLRELSHFLKIACVGSFSQSASRHLLNVNDGTLDDNLTAKVRRSKVSFARVFYYKVEHRVFDSARESGAFSRLEKLKVVSAEEVEVLLVLEDIRRKAAVDIAREGERILYRKGAKSIEDKLASELCSVLGAPEELSDIFARILLANGPQDIEDFLEAKRIGALPPDMFAEIEKIPLTAVIDVYAEEPAEGAVPEELRSKEPSGSAEGLEAPIDEIHNAPPLNSMGKTKSGTSESIQPSMPEVPSSLAGHSEVQYLHQQSSNTENSNSDILGLGSPVAKSPELSDISGETGELLNDSNELSAVNAPNGRTSDSNKTEITNQILGHGEYGELPITGSHKSDVNAASSANDRTSKGTMESAPFSFPADGESKGGKGSGGKHKKRNRTGRLISYVVRNPHPDEVEHEPDSAAALEKRRTGELAVRFFMQTQSVRWKSLTEMDHFNPGFDVLAVAHDGEEEFVEVKGQSAAWTESGVTLSSRELQEAQKRRGRFWLCVVEYVHDDLRRRLYLFQDPFGLAKQFLFDSGWKDAAIAINDAPLQPHDGLFIEIPGDGRGKIISAKKRGKLFHLHVLLESGKQKNLLFKPDKMTISEQ